MSATDEKLAKLRAPFDADELELLPRFTGKKVDLENGKQGAPKDSYRRCDECGGYHAFPCVHLTYVGHAGITQRLLDVDPEWNWEPVALAEDGSPLLTRAGNNHGMWIRLTVLGTTRLGFGDAGDKEKLTGSAIKEIIGDAIRNGAMRFGVGTYLWSKSDKAKAELTRMGADDEEPKAPAEPPAEPKPKPRPVSPSRLKELRELRVKLGVDVEKYAEQLAHFDVGNDEDLTDEDAKTLIKAYKGRTAGATK